MTENIQQIFYDHPQIQQTSQLIQEQQRLTQDWNRISSQKEKLDKLKKDLIQSKNEKEIALKEREKVTTDQRRQIAQMNEQLQKHQLMIETHKRMEEEKRKQEQAKKEERYAKPKARENPNKQPQTMYHYCEHCGQNRHCKNCCKKLAPNAKSMHCKLCDKVGHPETCCPFKLRTKEKQFVRKVKIDMDQDEIDNEFYYSAEMDPNAFLKQQNMATQEVLAERCHESLRRMEQQLVNSLSKQLEELDNNYYLKILDQIDKIDKAQAYFIYESLKILSSQKNKQLKFYQYSGKINSISKQTILDTLRLTKGIGSMYINWNEQKIKGLWVCESTLNSSKYMEVDEIAKQDYYLAVDQNWVFSQDKSDFIFHIKY